MYKWVNEKGETIFSDQVPPEQAQHRREALNEKGRVVEITEQAKTKEQQAMDNRLEALRKAQEKIIEQQKANDKVLLSTFRNLDDMQASLYATMQSLDSQRNVAQGNLKRVEIQLETQQKQAGTLERNGKKVPQTLPAYPITALDTTGAGDAFHGAFAAALAIGMEWTALLRYASAAGALCCTQMGARLGLPSQQDHAAFNAASEN